MFPRFFLSLRFRLMVLVLLVILPIFLLTLYTSYERYQADKKYSYENSMRLVKLAAANQEQLIEGARQLLIALSELPEIQNQHGSECSQVLSRILSQHTLYYNFGVVDLNGQIFCSALPIAEPVDASQRVWFQRAIQEQNFAIGIYQIGRITKKATVNFAYPVQDETGGLKYVVFAALNLEEFNKIASQLTLPAGAVLTIFDSEGTILARQPRSEEWTGKKIQDAALVQSILAQHEGVTELKGVDGVSRFYAYTYVGSSSQRRLYLSVGMPVQAALASALKGLSENLIGLAVVAFLALGMAGIFGEFFILKRISALVRATHRLGEGDLTARTGLKYGKEEISQLAESFDSMAAALEKRQMENEVARRKIAKLNEELEGRVIERTKELEVANKELESFSYSVSHDLRAPLRHINGFADLLVKNSKDKLDSKSNHYLDVIIKSAKQMGELIDDLLSFSRMGRTEMMHSRVHAGGLVKGILEEMKPFFEGRDVRMQVDSLREVEADASMLRVIFMNLISNAVKYTKKCSKAEIHIGCYEDPKRNELVFFIKDNGVGFDMQYAHKLFGVFQRLHSHEEFEGTGVGLATVQRIIHRHKGRVWAEAKVNEGAVFYFSLPMASVIKDQPSVFSHQLSGKAA